MNNTESVTVFSTPSCPWCTHTKDYLEQNGVEFTDVDVSSDLDQARRMIEKSGHQGVPQLWVGGKVIVGFDKESIDEVFGIGS